MGTPSQKPSRCDDKVEGELATVSITPESIELESRVEHHKKQTRQWQDQPISLGRDMSLPVPWDLIGCVIPDIFTA
eukprot:5392627-Amphidinium_carterae.1